MTHTASWKRTWDIGLLVLAFGIRTATAAESQDGVTFLYPPNEGLTFYYLDTVNVTYESPFPDPILWTFCQNGQETKAIQRASPFNSWTLVFLNFTSEHDAPCYFNLRPNMSAGFGANSDSFTLVNRQRSLTTVGLNIGPTSTAATTATTTAHATPTSTSSSPPNVTPGPNGNGRVNGSTDDSGPKSALTTGAQVGIAISVAFGLLAVAWLGAAACGRRTRALDKRNSELESKRLSEWNGMTASALPLPGEPDSHLAGIPHWTAHPNGEFGGWGGVSGDWRYYHYTYGGTTTPPSPEMNWEPRPLPQEMTAAHLRPHELA